MAVALLQRDVVVEEEMAVVLVPNGILVDDLVVPVEMGAALSVEPDVARVDEITQSAQLVGTGAGVGLYRLISFHRVTRHRSRETEK